MSFLISCTDLFSVQTFTSCVDFFSVGILMSVFTLFQRSSVNKMYFFFRVLGGTVIQMAMIVNSDGDRDNRGNDISSQVCWQNDAVIRQQYRETVLM